MEKTDLEKTKKNALPLKWATPKLVRLTREKAEGDLLPAVAAYFTSALAFVCNVDI